MMFEILSVLKYMTNSGTYNETKNVMDTKITVLGSPRFVCKLIES